MKQFFKKVVAHFKAMGNLEGAATDYPAMFAVYFGIFILCFIACIMLCVSRHGKRVVWLSDQNKCIKSKFSYMAMLACTFTGVFLVGSFPSELQKSFGTWNADFFYTVGQTAVMLIAGVYSLATYKTKKNTVLNILSIMIGLSTSIPIAASAILSPLDLNGVWRIVTIVALIVTIGALATLSVKKDLLVKYSRINIYMFVITSIALFTTIATYDNSAVDTSKILPFQGMINARSWKEWLTNPYWWYFESTVVSWAVFCGRFVAYCSNGYSIRQIILYGTASLVILTVIWHVVSAATGYTLSFSRGIAIYVLTAMTMLAFAVTSLDSATKTLVSDATKLLSINHSSLMEKRKMTQKKLADIVTYGTMALIAVINIILLITGFPKLFTMLFCLIFIPFFVRAIIYSVRFAIGKIDYSITGTITKEEFEAKANAEEESEEKTIAKEETEHS